jgi:starch synthase
MMRLKDKYPNSFWADPNAFFTDGSLVNRGTDFGLMPSIFEPGGIVQHEFFVGGTPVVAFKTGGLKDSVFEYKWDKEEGNGYTFENHTVSDFTFAIERAIGTFNNKPKYLKLRENAFASTMDGSTVSRAWLKEFFRLRRKVFVDENIIKTSLNELKPWGAHMYKPVESFEELFGIKQRIIASEVDIDLGAEEDKEKEVESSVKVQSHFEA